MIILPLGLGKKIPRVPWLTITIALVTIGVSFWRFPHLKTAQDKVAKLRLEENLYQRQLVLLQEGCPRFLEPASCAVIDQVVFNLGKVEASSLEGLYGQMAVQLQRTLSEDRSLVAMSKDEQKKLFKYAQLIFDMQGRKVEKNFGQVPSYPDYQATLKNYRTKVAEFFRQDAILARDSVSPQALLQAELTHAGLMHLFGNLLYFLAFAIYIEFRLSALQYLAVYFIGGTIGMLVQVKLLPQFDINLLGASANISAMMGAFFVLFFQKPMRLIVWAWWSRVVECPTYVLFPVFFLLGDLTGLLAGGGGVAHMAHLMGMVSGGALALLFSNAQPMAAGLLYRREVPLLTRLQSAPQFSLALLEAKNLLRINPHNFHAKYNIFKRAQALDDSAELKQAHEFLQEQIGSLVQELIQAGEISKLDDLLTNLPMEVNLLKSWAVDASTCERLSFRLLQLNNPSQAIRWYFLARLKEEALGHEIDGNEMIYLQSLYELRNPSADGQILEFLRSKFASPPAVHFKDYRTGSIFLRLVAFLLDLLIAGGIDRFLRVFLMQVLSVRELPKSVQLGLAIVVAVGYWIVPLVLTGQTIGKRMVGLTLVAHDRSQRLGAPWIVLREFSKLFVVGYLFVFFNPLRKALHDYMGKSMVVDSSETFVMRPVVP